VLLAVIYFMLRLLLRLPPEGDVREREAEILVLRQQLAVLKRKADARSCAMSTGCSWPPSPG
jgi:hypothetical protein